MPELRQDPITGRWVILATERARRPQDYERRPVVAGNSANCPFCEGREKKTPPEVFSCRVSGEPDEPGWTVRVIPNKFPALRLEGSPDPIAEGIYRGLRGVGSHEVVIESPDHAATLGSMKAEDVAALFFAFRQRVLVLRRNPAVRYVMLFKNHGESAGASLAHTHSQLIALPVVPVQLQEEIDGARRWLESRRECVYCRILSEELGSGRRLVLESEHFVVLCPYAPRYPFETWVLPRAHGSHFEEATNGVLMDLGRVMQGLIARLEQLLDHPAYNLVVHTAPLGDEPLECYHWHVEIAARLTREAGFEWGSGFYINPTPPEEAAAFLREG